MTPALSEDSTAAPRPPPLLLFLTSDGNMSLYHQARERHWPGGGAVIGRPVRSRRSIKGKERSDLVHQGQSKYNPIPTRLPSLAGSAEVSPGGCGVRGGGSH